MHGRVRTTYTRWRKAVISLALARFGLMITLSVKRTASGEGPGIKGKLGD